MSLFDGNKYRITAESLEGSITQNPERAAGKLERFMRATRDAIAALADEVARKAILGTNTSRTSDAGIRPGMLVFRNASKVAYRAVSTDLGRFATDLVIDVSGSTVTSITIGHSDIFLTVDSHPGNQIRLWLSTVAGYATLIRPEADQLQNGKQPLYRQLIGRAEAMKGGNSKCRGFVGLLLSDILEF